VNGRGARARESKVSAAPPELRASWKVFASPVFVRT
jgi:hypothetical protein